MRFSKLPTQIQYSVEKSNFTCKYLEGPFSIYPLSPREWLVGVPGAPVAILSSYLAQTPMPRRATKCSHCGYCAFSYKPAEEIGNQSYQNIATATSAYLQISVFKLVNSLGSLVPLIFIFVLGRVVTLHTPLVVSPQSGHAILQSLELLADPPVLLVVELPVGPLLRGQVVKHV